jgi:dihydroorotase
MSTQGDQAAMLLVNGRVIDPASRLDSERDVAIAGGRVAAVGKKLPRTPASRVIDCGGLIVTPGLIDPHVHLREPGQEHKETIATGSLAAAGGGFASVCCMPNTTPALDSPEALALVEKRAREAAGARVFPVAAATRGRKGEELAEIMLLARAGAAAFSDDGDCIASAGMMLKVLHAVKQTGRCFMQHCQEPTLTRGASMHAGEIALRLGLSGWPRVAEELIIERDVRLNRGVGCRYHAQHVSSGGSVEILRAARKAGQPVTAEATPHHLTLTHEACLGYNTNAKVNPPLREKSDIAALQQGVADGTITVLGTDHAPHAADEKSLPFEEAPFGFVGLETALPLYIESLVAPGVISWAKFVAMMTTAPASLCLLDGLGLGRVAVGGPADVTVIDPERGWVCSPAELSSKSLNTPYMGRKMKGRAVLTVVGGVVVMDRLGSSA